MQRISVDLPEPEGPQMTMRSPRATVQVDVAQHVELSPYHLLTLSKLTAAHGGALPDPAFWDGRRVLLTGHTGFKGSWLTCWLQELGADVMGVSLPELPTEPSLWEQLGTDAASTDVRADITSGDWMARGA